jgi:hypothetical protein
LAAAHADAPFVREHLKRLPVPTVRVPAAATNEPWWLALVAHEASHHVQFGADLVTKFRDAVEHAITRAGGDEAAVERWSGWSVELFADLASVAMLGPWAMWPIAELELRDPMRMAEPRGAYPPGVVRLRLLAAAVECLGLDASVAWPSGSPPAYPDALDDLGFVDDVVAAGLATGVSGLELGQWVDLRPGDFAPGGMVDQWRVFFCGGGVPSTAPSLRAPRLVVAGIVAATAEARRSPEKREAILGVIRTSAFEHIVALRAPGRRARDEAGPADVDLEPLATALSQADEADLEWTGAVEPGELGTSRP